MIHGDSSRPRSSSETWVARAIPAVTRASVVALLLASGASLGAGCDSSNDSDQPFPEFEGRWAVDVDKSSVTCQQTDIGMQAISPWSDPPTAPGESLGVVTIEAGVLTDLVETSSECLFGYNVNPKIAEPQMMANTALSLLNEHNVSALIVVDNERPVGLVHFHDLLRIGVA